MNTDLKKLILVLIAAFFFMQPLFAADGVSLTVSCTIPAVPGVNAPPFQDKFPGHEAIQREEMPPKADNLPEKPPAEVETKTSGEIILVEAEQGL